MKYTRARENYQAMELPWSRERVVHTPCLGAPPSPCGSAAIRFGSAFPISALVCRLHAASDRGGGQNRWSGWNCWSGPQSAGLVCWGGPLGMDSSARSFKASGTEFQPFSI